MKSSFTFDDLFLFAYNETLETEDHMVHREQEDQELKNELKEMMGNDLTSDDESVSPDKRIICNIMSYSRALSVIRTKQAGNINLLLN
ncbi:MAG: hypothetical protein KQI35_09085 [Bacteroidetes bacterium]|nr:hypothetical protein [Bacteroidota bacterium]